MSALTSKEILAEFYAMVKGSPLAEAVNGEVYYSHTRPRDSEKEDITVAFVTGLADQMQTGVIAVGIYVPDIKPYENGVYVEDMERTKVLERIAQDWLDAHPEAETRYYVEQQGTVATIEDKDIHQHFISVMLRYQFLNE